MDIDARIEAARLRIEKIEDRIGSLMTQRVDAEEKLAELIKKRNAMAKGKLPMSDTHSAVTALIETALAAYGPGTPIDRARGALEELRSAEAIVRPIGRYSAKDCCASSRASLARACRFLRKALRGKQ